MYITCMTQTRDPFVFVYIKQKTATLALFSTNIGYHFISASFRSFGSLVVHRTTLPRLNYWFEFASRFFGKYSKPSKIFFTTLNYYKTIIWTNFVRFISRITGLNRR